MSEWGGKRNNIGSLNAQRSQIDPLFAAYLQPLVVTGWELGQTDLIVYGYGLGCVEMF
jgi:hypothetical protein